MRSDQMMYKNFNNMAPEYFRDLFKSEHETHERSLRSVDKELLNIPFCVRHITLILLLSLGPGNVMSYP